MCSESHYESFSSGSVVKNLPANAGDPNLIPGLGRSPREGNGQPMAVFLPGKSQGQRSLVGCSPRGLQRVEHDWMTENTHMYDQVPSLFTWNAVLQLCPILCNLTDCSLPGFSVHGILQAKILEWVAIPFSMEYSWLRDQTCLLHVLHCQVDFLPLVVV